MAIVLTVVADGPAALAELWGHLGGNKAEVDIVGDEMFIAVDLTTPEPEPEAQVEEVLSHPIHRDGPWEDAEEAPEPDHDGHTVDVGQVEEVEAEAEVVPIDAGSRAKHPAGKAVDADSCAGAILAALTAEPDVQFTVMDIVAAVDGYKESTIKFTTAQLTRDGQIARVGRGLYQAVQAS